ncbi:MAG: CvpA family protein [Syntrophobacteraceae bacterium]
MNILDWILIGTAAFCVLRGLMRGAVSQLFGIVGILAGFLVASYQYYTVSFFLAARFPAIAAFSRPLSFVLLFLLTWFCLGVVGLWIVKLLRVVGLGFIDRLWGAMIGFGKAFLFAMILISILTLFSFGGNSSLIATSRLAPPILKASNLLFELAPANVQTQLADRQRTLQDIISRRASALIGSFAGTGSKGKDANNKN